MTVHWYAAVPFRAMGTSCVHATPCDLILSPLNKACYEAFAERLRAKLKFPSLDRRLMQSVLCRYGNISYFDQPDKATADLKAYLQAYQNIYQRNIWLTEFALADFGNSTNNYTFTFASYPQQVAFLKAATAMLESLSFVERYAWYYLSPDGVYDGQNGLALDTGSLYFQNGSPTPTGLAFQPL